MTLGTPAQEETNGDHANVVVPGVHTLEKRGVAMREAAHPTFALQESAGSWLIRGEVWIGPRPQPLAAAQP